MKIVVSGGGTGGHIFPALALIKTIKKQNPDTEFLYIGSEKGLEADIIGREQIPFNSINITGFKRSISLENVKTIIRFLTGVSKCKKILKQFNPDIVIGTGGYVCGPVVYAAAKSKIPTIIHEQNSVPGLTNKFLSRYVDKVAVSFDQVIDFFPKEKVLLTGNPRASEVIAAKSIETLPSLGLKNGVNTALIVGGSRGARPINDAVIKALSQLGSKPYQVIYVTGQTHYEEVKKEAELLGEFPNIVIKPFIHNMQEVLAVVDLVIGRAGATSLAEITALGLPSILIPSPYVTNNHQVKNAEALVEKGAASIILENDLTSNRLLNMMDSILLDREQREKMSLASKQLGIPDASDRLFTLMKQLTKLKN